MYSEPRKLVVTGLVVGAIAVGGFAYVSQTEEDASSSGELGFTHGDDPGVSARGNMITGRITRPPDATRDDSAAAVAARLQAARNSLLRNDVAAARAQLNAVRPAHKNDEQVVALQKQIQMQAQAQGQKPAQPQANDERRALFAARGDDASSVTTPPSASALESDPTPAKTAHSHGSRSAAHWHAHSHSNSQAHRASRYAKSGRSPGSGQTHAGSDTTPATNVSSTEPQVTTPNPSAESTAPATPSPAVTQAAPSGDVSPKPDNSGPKTRSEVRAEIAHARQDGSLPTYGNPDPAGPGGAPSMNGAQRR